MSTTDQPIRATTTNTTLQLTVAEGVGLPRGSAYISPSALSALECVAGDVVLIQGNRATVARIYPWPTNDDPAQLNTGGVTSATSAIRRDDRAIQMDGLVRQNAGAALGDLINLRRVDTQAAISAALVPVAGPAALGEPELRHVARSLKGLAAVAGDLIRVPGMGLSVREFQLIATNPASPVLLDAGTSIRIQAPGGP
ncbi:MAG: hypothetical protein ABI068_08705, partial [Ktedonobacterales bacterium]